MPTAAAPVAPKRRQKRAEETRDKICEAAITLLGRGGAKAVTHRAVAQEAGISLASTTYHFEDKAALLTAAFDWLIDGYILGERNKLEQALAFDLNRNTFAEHVLAVSKIGMTEPHERLFVCSWYEFMLEAAREPTLQGTAQKWYKETSDHYQRILEKLGTRRPGEDARRLLDFLIGYEFINLAIRPRRLSGSASDVYARLIESMFDDDKKKQKPSRRAKTSKARPRNA